MQIDQSQPVMKSTRFGYEVDLLGDTREVHWAKYSRELTISDLSETEARKLVMYLQAADRLTAASMAPPGPARPATPPMPAHAGAMPQVKPSPYTPPESPGETRSSQDARHATESVTGDSPASGTPLDAAFAKLNPIGGLDVTPEDQAEMAKLAEEAKQAAENATQAKPARKSRKPRKPRTPVEDETKAEEPKAEEPKAEEPADDDQTTTGAAIAAAVQPVLDKMAEQISGAAQADDLPQLSDAAKAKLRVKIEDINAKTDAVEAERAAKASDDPMARFKGTRKKTPPKPGEFVLTTEMTAHGCPVIQAGREELGGSPVWVGVLSDGATVIYDLDGTEQDYMPAEPDEPGEAVIPPDEPTAGIDPGKVVFPGEQADASPAADEPLADEPEKTEDKTTEPSAEGEPWALQIEGRDSILLPDAIRDSGKVNTVVNWLMVNDPKHKASENGKADRDLMVAQLTALAPVLKSMARTKPGRIGNRVDNTLTLLGAI